MEATATTITDAMRPREVGGRSADGGARRGMDEAKVKLDGSRWFRQIDTEKKNNRESERDVIALQKMNVELQNRLEKYRKREMELLRALKAQQAKVQRRKIHESSNAPLQSRRSSSTLQQQSH